jgi:hypothetical protein
MDRFFLPRFCVFVPYISTRSSAVGSGISGACRTTSSVGSRPARRDLVRGGGIQRQLGEAHWLPGADDHHRHRLAGAMPDESATLT